MVPLTRVRAPQRLEQVCAKEAAMAAWEGLKGNCSALQRCLESAIGAGQLPGWQNIRQSGAGTAAAAAGNAASRGLAFWFLVFFILRHTLGHTLVMIPYDALGQELTSDSDARQVRLTFCLTHAMMS